MNNNQLIHGAFETTVAAKGMAGFFEVAGGLALLFFRTSYLHAGTQRFITVYLLFYGLVNLFLVVALLRGRLWAYPAALIGFSLFTAYMVIRFLQNHSLLLLAFSAYDIFLIVLISLEYQRVKKLRGDVELGQKKW